MECIQQYRTLPHWKKNSKLGWEEPDIKLRTLWMKMQNFQSTNPTWKLRLNLQMCCSNDKIVRSLHFWENKEDFRFALCRSFHVKLCLTSCNDFLVQTAAWHISTEEGSRLKIRLRRHGNGWFSQTTHTHTHCCASPHRQRPSLISTSFSFQFVFFYLTIRQTTAPVPKSHLRHSPSL